jgi:CRP-like cAMP-binding protein
MKLPLKRYAAGDLLIRQGARATDEVFLIKSGKVDVFVSPVDAAGNILRDQSVKVATREPGEFIGEMARGASMIAKTLSSKSDMTTEQRIAAVLRKGAPVRSRNGNAVTLKSWISARIYAKKWIGGRRNADLVAQDNVVCLVMGRNEMSWALASDPEVAAELAKDMNKRRQELDQAKSPKPVGSDAAKDEA